jgi:hypothetical protein
LGLPHAPEEAVIGWGRRVLLRHYLAEGLTKREEVGSIGV